MTVRQVFTTRTVAAVIAAGPADASRHPTDIAAAAGMPPWRSAEFLRGRQLLRQAIFLIEPDLASEAICRRSSGQPYLPEKPSAGLSVSHDGAQLAAAAALDCSIGIDLQGPVPGSRTNLGRRFSGPDRELLEVLDAERIEREIAWVWTAQEACVKAAGLGLAGRPWAIDIHPHQTSGIWGAYKWRRLTPVDEYPVSMAVGPTTITGPPEQGAK